MLTQGKTFACAILLTCTLLAGCQKQTPTDTSATTDRSAVAEVDRYKHDDPRKALDMTDSLHRTGRMAGWRADSLKARILSEDIWMIDSAVILGQKCLDNDTVTSHPALHIRMLRFVARRERTLGHHSHAIEHSLKGQKLADSIGDNVDRALFEIVIGSCLYSLKNKTQGERSMLRGVTSLEKGTSHDEMRLLSYGYGQLMESYWGDDNDRAIAYGKKREALLDRLSKTETDTFFLDREYGFLYAKMADFYGQKKDLEQARAYADKYQQTRFSQTVRGKYQIIDYYNSTRQYDEFLRLCLEGRPYWDNKDTVCSRYANVLAMIGYAYEHTGNYRKAIELRNRKLVLLDSLQQREAEEDGLRLPLLYAVHEKELALEKSQDRRAYNRKINVLFSALLLGAFLFGAYYYKRQKDINTKNKILAKYIDELSEQVSTRETGQKRPKTADSSDETADTGLISADELQEKTALFRRLFDEEKVFLQPDLSRLALQQMLGVSKNVLSPILREAIGDAANLSDYITTRRIQYAARLLKERPDDSITSISADAGFYTTRNFRRCFKEKMGMTPGEYRAALEA